MKLKSFTPRGQALILITLAGIGLFGIAGLAIDGSAKFSDRRHAQNAADTAALAAALEIAREQSHGSGPGVQCPPTSGSPTPACADAILAALERAAENGYDNVAPSNTVEVNIPPASGIYSNCADVHFNCRDYVQVIIESNVDTWFARVIGIDQTHNRVEAVASYIAEDSDFNFGGNAIVALSQEGCAFVAGGTTDVNVIGGGFYSNSDASCAFKKTTCSGNVGVWTDSTMTTEGTITTVGGYQTNSNCTGSLSADMATGATQLPFPPPYQELPEPPECLTNGGISNPDGFTTLLTPGSFDQIPGNGNAWKDNIILTPGVYCLTGTGYTLDPKNNQTVRVQGTFNPLAPEPGVFIYFQPGGSFNFNAQTTGILWGMSDTQIDADPANLEPYRGFLFYVAPDYASGTTTNCKINGGTDDAFMGTVYAPYCDLTINGNSSSDGFQSQFIAYTVDLTGASGLTLTYNDDTMPVWEIPLQVGLNR